MNTWFVGSHPVGHYVYLHPEAKEQMEKKQINTTEDMPIMGDKTFFMKARILAGQADIKNNEVEAEDFKWLVKEEVQKHVHPYYWSKVKNMLVDQ